MDTTPNLNLPIPNADAVPATKISEEFPRLADALIMLDAIIFALQGVVAGKAESDHTQAISTITGLTEALAAKMPANTTFSLDSLTDVQGATDALVNYVLVKKASGQWEPSTALAALGIHNHAISEVVGLTEQLLSILDDIDQLSADKANADSVAAALGLKANSADVYTKSADPIPMAKSPPRLVWVNGTTVTVKADKCRDELDAVNLVFPSDINVVLAGAPVSAHRHVLVGYDGTGTPAAVFSTTDALPSGWQAYRRAGSIRTDGAGSIYKFTQVGDRVEYTVPINVLSYTNNAPNTVQLTALLVPVGMPVVALLTCQVIQSGGGSGLDVWCPDHGTGRSATNGAAAMTTATAVAGAVASNASTTSGVIALVDVLTNASGQVNVRSATSGATLNVQVRGYIDRRGRDK